jgi:hypothetical protein
MNIVNIKNNRELAAGCLKRLKQALGPSLGVRLVPATQRDRDFDLRIETKPLLRLPIETKTRIGAKNEALHLILQLRELADAMVFADWISEPAAEEFRKAGVFFIDVQGNAFIQKPPKIVMDIRGKKPDRPLKAEPGRLIEPGGLKIVHYLLTHPQDAGSPLRAIAEGAGVALGTAHAVIKELERGQRLLPAPGGKRRFGDLKGLLDLFVRGYGLKLRPASLLGRYKHRTRDPQEILDGFARRLAGLKDCWAVTGGMAARRLTHHLEPDVVTLFVNESARERLKNEPMLRDDATGNVTLLQLFGDAVVAEKPRTPWPLATTPLVYAELIETGGAREIETARMIYERFLEPQISHGK